MEKPVILGITGGSGSGKSWLARRTVEHFGPANACLLEQDWYYRDLSHLPVEEAARSNFDEPAALELDLLAAHLEDLANGVEVEAPQYDFSRFTRKKEVLKISPRPLIVVEGLFILGEPNLSEKLDLSVFVDTASDIRLLRRIRRDLSERGYQLERVLDFWERCEVPSFTKFVLPQRSSASLVWDSPQDTSFVPTFLADLQNRTSRNAAKPTPKGR